MANKLMINCASCDARNIAEENYTHYESITINSATVITNAEAKAVMNRLPVTLNCANVIEVAGDVVCRTVNGKCEIKSDDTVAEKPFYLMVNGVLNIGPDTQKQLARCAGMTVNGSLVCPESIYATLSGVTVNGSTSCYPDRAIVLKRNAVIDRLFSLRAKNKLYWAAKRMILVDPELDGEALRRKGVTLCAREVIIAQSKVEALLDLIDEKAEITIVPDGTAVVLDDITLDDATLRRHGTRLYVIGDVTVPAGADLDRVDYLNIRGDARVPLELKEKFLELVTEISGTVKVAKPKGVCLHDKPQVRITRWMLEQQPQGIEVSDCATVKIADDIPKEWIVERLHVEDCANVQCSKEQEDAVSMVCEDVAEIDSTGGEASDAGGALAAGIRGMLDTRVVNAAEYVL